MRALLLLPLALLLGCAHDQLVRAGPDVPVIIIEPCIAEVPPIPPSRMPPPGSNVERLAAGASADVRKLEEYAAKADAIFRACVDQPKESKP